MELPLSKTHITKFPMLLRAQSTRLLLCGRAAISESALDVKELKMMGEEKVNSYLQSTKKPSFLYTVLWMKAKAFVTRVHRLGNDFYCRKSTLGLYSHHSSVNELISIVWTSLYQFLMTCLFLSGSVNLNCICVDRSDGLGF